MPRRLAVLLSALALSWPALARAPYVGEARLRQTVSGALLEVTLTARDREGDVLRGVWAAGARANFLRCTPRCALVDTILVQGQTQLGAKTLYRVVLGGRFEAGRKVGLVLSFADGSTAVREATVVRGEDGRP